MELIIINRARGWAIQYSYERFRLPVLAHEEANADLFNGYMLCSSLALPWQLKQRTASKTFQTSRL
jgi:hypothetical protein